MSPMFDLNSDDPDETLIRFTAGEKGRLHVYAGADRQLMVDLRKSERVIISWMPDRGRRDDA